MAITVFRPSFVNFDAGNPTTRLNPRMSGGANTRPLKRARSAAIPGPYAGVDVPTLLLADSYKATHPYMVSSAPSGIGYGMEERLARPYCHTAT